MRDVNKVILVGRLGGDPVQRETKTGLSVVNFSLATSRKSRDEQSEVLKEETQWHRIIAWGKEGENCAQYLKKGQTVYVEGSMRTRQYSTQEGESRTAFEVHADQVCFLGGGARREAELEAMVANQ